jgi:hypothetical protein
MFTPPSAAERPVTQQDAEHAWKLLNRGPWGLKAIGEADDVQRAFRARLREAHPDAGGDAAVAPKEIAELRAARDTLLRWLEQAPKADCKECGGTGYVWSKLSVKPCSRCG